jgi:hypothetical protein
MKRINLKQLVETELKRLYHNATLRGKLCTESDYESDLFQNEFDFECRQAIDEAQELCEGYGEVYQWGRGGRTLAPSGLIIQRGGSSFRIKGIEDLDLEPQEFRALYKMLKRFNDAVQNWCSTRPDEILTELRAEYSESLAENKNKKRVVRTVVDYI